MEVSEETKTYLDKIANQNDIDKEDAYEKFKSIYSEVENRAKQNPSKDYLEKLSIRALRTKIIERSFDGEKDKNKITYTRQEIYDIFIQRYSNGPKDYGYSEKGVKVLVGKFLNKYPKRYIKDNGEYPKGAIGSVFRRFQDTVKEGSVIQEDKMSWDELRRKVYKRDNYTCWECDENDTEVHAHHIIPQFADGEDYSRNLITLCSECHSDKHEWMNN